MEVKQKKGLGGSPSCSVSPISDYNSNSRCYSGKSYGVSRRGVRGNFIPPIRSNGNNTGNMTARIGGKCDDAAEDSTRKWYFLLAHKCFIKLGLIPAFHSFLLSFIFYFCFCVVFCVVLCCIFPCHASL